MMVAVLIIAGIILLIDFSKIVKDTPSTFGLSAPLNVLLLWNVQQTLAIVMLCVCSVVFVLSLINHLSNK